MHSLDLVRIPRVGKDSGPDGAGSRKLSPAALRLRARGGVAGLLVAQAALALEIDPYFLDPLGGRALPPVGEIRVASAALAVLALAGALVPARWRSAVNGFALVVGALTALLSSPANSARFHAFQLFLLGAALVLWVVALGRDSRRARVATRSALLALVLVLVELVFSFVARSHAVGYTLAARSWYSRYWQEPANSLGYRDVEPGPLVPGQPHVIVVGDSYVAGVGIADPRERFSDRLQASLGAGYQVHNLGWNGADTREEYERLARYPCEPAIVVLSYFVNDIAGAAVALGLRLPSFTPYRDLPWALTILVSRSYALDYLYWSYPHDDLARQGKFLGDCYARQAVVAQHQADLQLVVDWTREHGCRLIAVLFPDLTRIDASAAGLAPVQEVFARNQVPMVDVRELVRGKTTAELVVNRNDSHPSALVHARVAEALLAEVEALERAR